MLLGLLQTAKHAKMKAGKRLTGEYAKGFLTTGLFKYSRHPNFFAGKRKAAVGNAVPALHGIVVILC